MSEPKPDVTSTLVGMSFAFAIVAFYEGVMPVATAWWSYGLVCVAALVAAYVSYGYRSKEGVPT